MSENSRLNLKESHHSFLEKAKALNTHLAEDWEILTQYTASQTLPTELENSIIKAEEALQQHSQAWLVDSELKKKKRLLLQEGKKLYHEARNALIFLKPPQINWKGVVEKYGTQPSPTEVAYALLMFSEGLLQLEKIPPFLSEDIIEKSQNLYEQLSNTIAGEKIARMDQVSLRKERDDAFRELRAIKKLVKETGRFAFRNNPEMKKRYK